MKYTVCTTFNADGYENYGRRMIQTFLQNWPVDLVVYAEGCTVTESSPHLAVHNLSKSSVVIGLWHTVSASIQINQSVSVCLAQWKML